LSIENAVLEMTAKQLTNCAIPCYYAACGIGSPVDPPDAYKPCVRTRIEAAATGDFQLELTLQGANGEVYKTTGIPASGEIVRYIQVPLFDNASKLIPTGKYVLVARIKNSKADLGLAQMPVEIR
jgi:hypothetical protein